LNKYVNLLLDELSGKIAKDYTFDIAKYHRVQASPGFHEAAIYVQEQLKKIGLSKVAIEQFPADGKTKYWAYDAIISWRVSQAEIRMVEPENLILGRFNELPMSLATHSNSADVTAEVIDIGDGSKDEDYSGKNITGKIALVSGGARSAHIKSVEHGALGSIHHPPWNRAAEYPDLVQYNGIWPDQKSRDKVTFGFSISDRQYQMIKKYLDSGKVVKVYCKTDATLYDGYLDIVNAEFTGTEKPEEEIILQGHLCHPKTSTNDNASGSGVLIEIARAIKTLVDSGKIPAPKRTIRFLWVPEINGTYAWMHGHKGSLKNILATINLDMVGEHPVTVGGPLNLTCAPDSTPSYINSLLIEMLKDVADEPRGISIEGWPYGLNYRVLGYSGGSDHVCFADQAFGIPSVMFGNTDQFHHTSFDDASRVDSTKLKRVGVVSGGAALTIANANEGTSIELAAQTYSYANKRITETTARLISELLGIDQKNDDYTAKLGTRYLRGLAMLDETNRREAKAIMAAQKLSSTASSNIEMLVKQINDLVEAQKGVLKAVYEGMAAKTGAKILEKETDDVSETMKLIPKKTYEGPTRGISSDEILNEEDKKWFSANSMGTLFGRTTLELMNFVDGKHSVYDITIAVSLEHHNIEPSDVKRYLDIHNSVGKIIYL
jgi:aminopeptidase YwaD